MPNQHTKNPTPTADRFWAKVDKNGPVPDYAPQLGNCWLWMSGGSDDYGRFSDSGRLVGAHRWAYEEAHGAIPTYLECDHLCRVCHCVRPSHIELVTCRVNVLRGEGVTALNAGKTHCTHGHAFDEANTYIRKDGTRNCRTCHAEKERARHHLEAALEVK